MLPDGIDDGGREVDVKVTQKHNAVVILRIRTHICCYAPLKHLPLYLPPASTLTLIRSMPACSPAERSKFPPSFTYSYLEGTHRRADQVRALSLQDKRETLAHVPGEGGFLQSLPHVHVSAVVVGDDEVEVDVSGQPEQSLHVGDQLLDPAGLVFY